MNGLAPVIIAHRGASGYRPGAHPRLLPARHRAGRRLHRARPRPHPRRRAGRPARERDRRHHRRRRAPGVRRPPRPPRPSTAARSPAGSPRTSPSPSCKTLRAKERLPQVRPAQHLATTATSRSRPSTRSSTWPSEPAGAGPRRSASTRRPSTRPTSHSIGLSLEEPLVAALRRHRLDRPNAPVLAPVLRDRQPAGARRDDRRAARAARRGRRRAVRPRGGRRPALLRRPAHARGAAGGRDVRRRARPRTRTSCCRTGGAPSTRPTTPGSRCTCGRCATRTASSRSASASAATRTPAATRTAQTHALLDAGVDGIFTDHADTAVEARRRWLERRESRVRAGAGTP